MSERVKNWLWQAEVENERLKAERAELVEALRKIHFSARILDRLQDPETFRYLIKRDIVEPARALLARIDAEEEK